MKSPIKSPVKTRRQTQLMEIKEAYRHWENSRARLALNADWFEITDLMKALQKVKREYLANTVEAIEEAYKRIFVGLPKNPPTAIHHTYVAPYDKDKRFPANKKYVCDLFGDWKVKLTKLRVLCWEIMRKGRVEPNDNRFWKLLEELINDCSRGAYLLDRDEFESWGYVVWDTEFKEC